MGLLNLTIAELFTVLIPLSGILVALYFYDRSRRELVVSTLRFWPRRATYPMTTRRKKLRQPWSLLLQLLAALLLLLAIADFRFLTGDAPPRRHVVILETSAAMGARNHDAVNDGLAAGTLMDVARRRAVAYLRAIPAADSVMLIRCDANPALAVGFTTDREKLRDAIEQSTAGWTAPHLAGALELARSALELAGEDGSAAQSERRPAGEVAAQPGTPALEALDDELAITTATALTWDATPKTTLDLEASRDFQESSTAEASSFNATRVTLGITAKFSDMLSTTIRGAYERDDFNALDRSDDIWQASTVVQYDWRAWLGFELGYEHVTKRSDDDTIEYDVNRFWLLVRGQL